MTSYPTLLDTNPDPDFSLYSEESVIGMKSGLTVQNFGDFVPESVSPPADPELFRGYAIEFCPLNRPGVCRRQFGSEKSANLCQTSWS